MLQYWASPSIYIPTSFFPPKRSILRKGVEYTTFFPKRVPLINPLSVSGEEFLSLTEISQVLRHTQLPVNLERTIRARETPSLEKLPLHENCNFSRGLLLLEKFVISKLASM